MNKHTKAIEAIFKATEDIPVEYRSIIQAIILHMMQQPDCKFTPLDESTIKYLIHIMNGGKIEPLI